MLIIGLLFFDTGCRPVDWDGMYTTAVTNENYAGAKRLIRQQLTEDAFRFPKEGSRARAYYRLAYAHGKLAEFDSMKISLDSAIANNGNLAKAKRELIEYFSLEEFNNAVTLYNNFFFDKAIAKLQLAISIIGNDSAYEEYRAIIYRCLAYAEASNKNIDKALEYCRRASNLGDALSQRVLVEWEKEQKLNPPEKLEPREKPAVEI